MKPPRCPARDGRYCMACAHGERCPEQVALEESARTASLNPCECGGMNGDHTSICRRYE